MGEFDGPVQVAGVVLLVGVDEHQVEGPLDAGQGVQRRADQHLDAVAETGALDVGAGDLGVLGLVLECRDATVRPGGPISRMRRAPVAAASRLRNLPCCGETAICGRPAASLSFSAAASTGSSTSTVVSRKSSTSAGVGFWLMKPS